MNLKKSFFKSFGSRKVLITYAACLFITISTMVASIVLSMLSARHTTEKMTEHIALCILAIILLDIPLIMQARFKFQIPAFFHITIAIFVIAHCILGEIYRFYDYMFLFDKALHVTAGVVIAILGFSIVYGFTTTESGSVKLSPFFVALFSFCFTLALLLLWEVFEYGMDSLFGMNMQRWQDGLTEAVIDGVPQLITAQGQGSGLKDTMSDLIVGVIGAGIICITGGFYLKKFPNSTRFFIIRAKGSKTADLDSDTDATAMATVPQVLPESSMQQALFPQSETPLDGDV